MAASVSRGDVQAGMSAKKGYAYCRSQKASRIQHHCPKNKQSKGEIGYLR